jgi:hypothetical protein
MQTYFLFYKGGAAVSSQVCLLLEGHADSHLVVAKVQIGIDDSEQHAG